MSTPQAEAWQLELRQSFHDAPSLLAFLQIESHPPQATSVAHFPLRVTRHFAALMKKADLNDPLLKQVLPQSIDKPSQNGVTDAVGDVQATVAPGLIHKYRSRALVISTGACAIHCRYCFRQHFDYSGGSLTAKHQSAASTYLAKHPEINELILSGGDPLSLSERRLNALLEPLLAHAPHIKTLRIHSRQPVVLPSRLSQGFADWLTQYPQKIVMVLHINHPQEISPALAAAIARMPRGVLWLNQAVLLKGINDSLDVQIDLSQQLFAAGILPYYLNQLDRVRDVTHFAVSDEAAISLHTELQKALAGYLVPRLIKDLPDRPNKTPLYPR